MLLRHFGPGGTNSADLGAVQIHVSAFPTFASPALGSCSISGRNLGVKFEESSLRTQQARQSEQRQQQRRVFGQPTIARLLVAEDVLDAVKWMVELGAHPGLELLEQLEQRSGVRFGQRSVLSGATPDMPFHSAVLIFVSLRNSLVARITERYRLTAVQKRIGLGDVAHIGFSRDHGRGEPRISIDTNVRLHTEVPLITLLGLVHFRVERSVLVFRRRRRCVDRRIDDSACSKPKALGGQELVDGCEVAFSQLVLFHQAPKLRPGRRIRRCLAAQVNSDKTANRLAIIDRTLHAFVGQSKALLGKVHVQHAPHPNRWPTATIASRMERLDFGHRRRPRRHRIDLAQKPIVSRHSCLGSIFKIRKARMHLQVPFKSQGHYFRRYATTMNLLPANRSVFS